MNGSLYTMRLTSSLTAALAVLALFAAPDCKSGPKKGDLTTPIQFVLKCEGGQPMREHRKRKEGTLTNKGPVILLPKDLTCGKAQDLPEAAIRDFKRTGVWTEYYSSGEKFTTVKYDNNKQTGLMEYYNKKGDRTRTVEYKDGLRDGPEMHYYAGTNDWSRMGQNKAGKRTGVWKKKSDRAGTCISEGAYENGYKEGEWAECGVSDDKKHYISSRATYVEGARSGLATGYFPSGAVFTRGNYQLDRECLTKEKSEGDRKEKCGRRSGQWTLYSETGKVAGTGSYDPANGLRTGMWTEHYASGEKLAYGERKHTRRGRWKFWDKAGNVLVELDFASSDVLAVGGVIYKDGRKVAESLPGEQCSERTSNGKTRQVCKIEAGGFLSALAKYDPKKDTFSYVITMKKGLWAYYGPGGNVVARGVCAMGKRDGDWITESGRQTYSMMSKPRPPRCD